MRYMILVKSPEPAPPPTSELIAEMGVFNDKLIKAGILLAAEGLQPSATGAKVKKENGQIVVRDGPFAEARELIGGFWDHQGRLARRGGRLGQAGAAARGR